MGMVTEVTALTPVELAEFQPQTGAAKMTSVTANRATRNSGLRRDTYPSFLKLSQLPGQLISLEM